MIIRHEKEDLKNSDNIEGLREKVKASVQSIRAMCPSDWEVISNYLRALTVPRDTAKNREAAADLYQEHSTYTRLAKDLLIFQ